MLRIVLAAVLLLLSLLTVFKAPTNFFWKAAVAINEFPYIPMALALLITLWGLRAEQYKWLLFGMHVATLVLFSLPVLRAYARTSNLDAELETAFGNTKGEQQLESPFSFAKMFSGIKEQQVFYSTHLYHNYPDRNLTFDFYPAQTDKIAPLVIVIHGGSWESGDSQQLPDLNNYLARKGFHVASMNYRLAPKHTFPAPVEDFNEVLAYLRKNAKAWKIDASKIVLIGRSAGGQIALAAAYSQHIPEIKGVVSFYAPADMEWGARIKTNKLVLDADKVLSDYIGGSVEDVPEKYELASAPHFVNKNTPPTLLIHGPIDAMVAYNHSVRLKKKLDEFGIKNYLLDLPTATHGCDYNFNGPSGQASTFAVERFIHSVFN